MARILLVEDNELNRDMLSRRLRRKGFEVEIAGDGRLGLDSARSGSFELILMDLSLPGLDGWTVARLLKLDPATRPIPIVALTAHAMAGDRERAIEAGCDDYDTKPIDFARLLAKVEALIPSGGRNPLADENQTNPNDLGKPSRWSILRHDLMGPLGRILGYCDLLMEEAEARDSAYRVLSLKAVKNLGEDARRAIDDALILWPDFDRPIDLDALIPNILGPSHAIIHACDAIEDASSLAIDRESFLEDLSRIRQDASLLISMAGQAVADPAKSSDWADLKAGPSPPSRPGGA